MISSASTIDYKLAQVIIKLAAEDMLRTTVRLESSGVPGRGQGTTLARRLSLPCEPLLPDGESCASVLSTGYEGDRGGPFTWQGVMP